MVRASKSLLFLPFLPKSHVLSLMCNRDANRQLIQAREESQVMHNRNSRGRYRRPARSRSRRRPRRNLGALIAVGAAVPVVAIGYVLASPDAGTWPPSRTSRMPPLVPSDRRSPPRAEARGPATPRAEARGMPEAGAGAAIPWWPGQRLTPAGAGLARAPRAPARPPASGPAASRP
jgi:hypothetical protein